MNNIYVLDKNYKKIGTLSNEGANPQAPYYEDLYVQELETGADTYQFSTTSSKYTQDILEIGNHIMFAYKNRNELFTITSLEYSHYEGYKTIGVYAEGIGFDLLEIYMKRPENEKDEGGRDEDNDGDTSTDDEYADLDDVYVDENGIIIYDKYGQDDYADPDNVSVDENGIIVYRRNKRNREKDSLEFKNISYSRFLSILLKNTGWSYVCQPGLESVKHDITVRYDTNIFALLQDSMQSYRGVELEFVHELVGGKVQKVIKAYKDGGRGSFVGKRFEYGTNVRGITKMQEVANSEDDTVLYVDNVGIAVQYDVDFALKSAEVPEIEIGDTHYVIDRDFCPPMQIKARIGKIEISFSDPTKNKIYLANNKRISGSAIEDEFGADDVADMLDDYEFDGDSGAAYDHYHDRLICWNEHSYTAPNGRPASGKWQTIVTLADENLYPSKPNRSILGTESNPWLGLETKWITGYDWIDSPRFFGYNYQVYYDREDMTDVSRITDSSNITNQDLLNFIMNDLKVYEYSPQKINEIVNRGVTDSNGRFGHQTYLGILSDDVFTHGSPCKTSKVGARIGKSLVEQDTNNDGDQNANDGHGTHTYNIPALLSCLIGAFQQHVKTGGGATTTGPSPKDQNAGYDGFTEVPPEGIPGIPGTGGSGGGDNPGTGEDGDNPGTGGDSGSSSGPSFDGNGNIQTSGIIQATEVIGNDAMYTTKLAVFPWDGGNPEILVTRGNGYDDNAIGTRITPDGIIFPDNSTLTSADGLSGEGVTPSTGNVFDTITVRKIQGPSDGGQYNRVEFASGIRVNYIWSADDDGIIYFEDDLMIRNKFSVSGDIILEEEDCAIVFPDGSRLTTANGIGSGGGTISGIPDGTFEYKQSPNSAQWFGSEWLEIDSTVHIANKNNLIVDGCLVVSGDLEQINYLSAKEADITELRVNGVPINPAALAATASTDLSEYATVEALQEEIRVKDEQIASLEARLAKIEAMLDINN